MNKAFAPEPAPYPLPPFPRPQGVGQVNMGFNWGDGFVTDGPSIAAFGISDARPFFAADSFATNRYKVALAPHVYGPVSASSGALDRRPGGASVRCAVVHICSTHMSGVNTHEWHGVCARLPGPVESPASAIDANGPLADLPQSVTGEYVMAKTQGHLLWDRLTTSWGAKSGCPTCRPAAAGTRQLYPSECGCGAPWHPLMRRLPTPACHSTALTLAALCLGG
jgi:hypothetical protein